MSWGHTVTGMALAVGVLTLLCLVHDTLRLGMALMPTAPKVQRLCVAALQSSASPTCLVELGAGLGSMALAFADAFPQLRVRAVEASPLAYALGRLHLGSRWALRRLRVSGTAQRISWRFENLLHTDLRGVDAVFCYLSPGHMTELVQKLRRELVPGASVISHTFALPGVVPQQVLQADDLYRTKVYVYRAPL
jgi:precorrin-6B methylase 2